MRGSKRLGRPARRQSYHHGDLRNSLIGAAAALVDLHGLDALTLREAARRAGVSQTAPYRHFRDRADLLGAVAADGFLMLVEDLQDALGSVDGAPRSERAAVLAEAYQRFASENPGRFGLMFMPGLPADVTGLEEARAAFVDCLSDGLGHTAFRRIWAEMHGRATLAAAGLWSPDPE